ncbi:MAG: hypothetical protein Q8K12_08225 [Thiobacillus sp.]|nr:hypothetical protein [Thiobacillus sp.]
MTPAKDCTFSLWALELSGVFEVTTLIRAGAGQTCFPCDENPKGERERLA